MILIRDISTRQDIELLVNTFYGKVQKNEVIGYIFNDVAKLDWEHHLPRMYSFWASLLLDEQSFNGNPMAKHIALSRKTDMTSKEFNEWVSLFQQTVDELFVGSKATEAKIRAKNIARTFLNKIESLKG